MIKQILEGKSVREVALNEPTVATVDSDENLVTEEVARNVADNFHRITGLHLKEVIHKCIKVRYDILEKFYPQLKGFVEATHDIKDPQGLMCMLGDEILKRYEEDQK